MQRRTQAIMQRRSQRDPGNEVAHNARRSGGNWPASPSGRVQYQYAPSYFMLQKLALLSLSSTKCFLLEYNAAYLFSRYLRYTTAVWTAQRKSTAHLKMALKKIIKINFTLQTSTKTGQLLAWLERRQGCQLIDIIVRPQAVFLFH